MALDAGYYVWHFLYSETSAESAFNVVFFVDMLTLSTMMSFPFFGAMHYALGYFDCCDDSSSTGPITLQSRIRWLLEDPGTQKAVSLALWCSFLYCVGDMLEFVPTFHQAWQGLTYLPFVACNILIFYGGLLLIVLTMRIVLVRLFAIEKQVEDALDLTEPRNYQTFRSSVLYQIPPPPNNEDLEGATALVANERAEPHETDNSANESAFLPLDASTANTTNEACPSFDPDQRALEWTQRYRAIRKDVHEVSEHFGVPMMLGLFLLVCETTSMIGTLWEEVGLSFGARETTALLLCFSTNAIMVCSAFYSMAYLITECSHHIGPKLAVLAVRCHDQSPRYQVLASAFLHAPIKIHVGVFEVAPEYASAIGLWFFGLFLVVFGLKMPGAE